MCRYNWNAHLCQLTLLVCRVWRFGPDLHSRSSRNIPLSGNRFKESQPSPRFVFSVGDVDMMWLAGLSINPDIKHIGLARICDVDGFGPESQKAASIHNLFSEPLICLRRLVSGPNRLSVMRPYLTKRKKLTVRGHPGRIYFPEIEFSLDPMRRSGKCISGVTMEQAFRGIQYLDITESAQQTRASGPS